MADTNVELLSIDPDAIAERVATQLRQLSRADASSELTYTPTGGHSYYRDLLLGGPAAEERLKRHASEMEQVAKERRERAGRLLRSGRFEFRVEPNRVDGQGGYLSPPAWLNQLFATASRPGRVLAGLMRTFPLPPGVSQINLPLLSTGTQVGTAQDNAVVVDQDIVDVAGSSVVEPFAGQADVSLQLLEQSPPGAHLDWAIFQDLSEAYDAQLETRLISGAGTSQNQILGVTQIAGINAVAYTDSTPTGAEMYPLLGQAAAQIGDNRLRPPECWLMRTARWAWLQTSEDTATLPFGIFAPVFLGSTDDTPDPVGGIAGWPVFLTDAIPATLGATKNQDEIICLRPSDLLLLEGDPQTSVDREPLSDVLGARIRMRNYAASITARRPTSISVVTGTGLVVQTGF